jgi:hypothetical protein
MHSPKESDGKTKPKQMLGYHITRKKKEEKTTSPTSMMPEERFQTPRD